MVLQSTPGAALQSLSSNDAIQFLLADIPIFTVGILACGTLTFFLLMKRMDRWIFTLHISVLLSFLASIFDLSQILLRAGSSNRVADDAARLITAREVFYTFSSALRFLFYWGFVAMIPLGEILENVNMHSGSWRRWGLPGIILKWTSLLLILTMAILQLVFRDDPAAETIGPVYETEAGLEIILSAVFILKLLLNTWGRFPAGSTTPSKGKMLMHYLPAVAALLFSLWIAVGNVILFEFTKTALGRLMRALELYILLVYILTISFRHLRHLSFYSVFRSVPKRARQSGEFQRSSTEKGNDMVRVVDYPRPPPPVDIMRMLEQQYGNAQELPQTIERNSARSLKVERAGQHQSMTAHMSTWSGMNRPLSYVPEAQPTQQPRSWDVDTERGPSPMAQDVRQHYADNVNANAESPSISQRIMDEDGWRGATPLPAYGSSQFGSGGSQQRLSIMSEAQAYESIKQATDIKAEQQTPVVERREEAEYATAQRASTVSEVVVANALGRMIQDQVWDDSLVNIEGVSPPLSPPSDYRTRLNNIAEGKSATPYPMSPVASAAVTPLTRSRPLPPMPGRPNSIPSSPLSPDSTRSSNMSILLRKQSELDKSIEALKLFSPSRASFDTSATPMTPSYLYSPLAYAQQHPGGLSPIPSENGPEFVSASPGMALVTPRPDHLPQSSAQSEFDFNQDQPLLNRANADSGVIPVSMTAAQAEHHLGIRTESPMNVLAPPWIPLSRFSDSSSVVDRRERRTDSQGTQYDITSFMGNLTAPANPKDSILSSSSAIISEDGFVGVATVATQRVQQVARPTLITQFSQFPRKNSETAAPRAVPVVPRVVPVVASRALPPIPQPPLRPLRQSPAGNQSGQPQAGAPRFRRAVGLPARPRMSAVTLTPVEETTTTTTPPIESATLVSPTSGGAGTALTGKA